MDKPRVDEIRGIPPAIAIEQSNPVKSSRSTVGTMTEINDYLKLLMPRVARAFCPSCGREIRPETAKSIADQMIARFGFVRLRCLTMPFQAQPSSSPSGSPSRRKPSRSDFFAFLQQQGYLRVWLNGEVVRADTDSKNIRLGARVQVIQDRLTISRGNARAPRRVDRDCASFREGPDQLRRSREQRGTSLFHRLALRALRSRYSPAHARTFQFQ